MLTVKAYGFVLRVYSITLTKKKKKNSYKNLISTIRLEVAHTTNIIVLKKKIRKKVDYK